MQVEWRLVGHVVKGGDDPRNPKKESDARQYAREQMIAESTPPSSWAPGPFPNINHDFDHNHRTRNRRELTPICSGTESISR